MTTVNSKVVSALKIPSLGMRAGVIVECSYILLLLYNYNVYLFCDLSTYLIYRTLEATSQPTMYDAETTSIPEDDATMQTGEHLSPHFHEETLCVNLALQSALYMTL